MKRYLILLAIFLGGCAPVQSAPTVDPNVGLALAEAEAARYEAQLTSTAQAWAMQQEYWTATAASWTPTPSLTPVPTATPSITPTPTVDVTATMVMVNAQAEMTRVALETERESNTNKAKAWLPYFVAIIALGLALFFGYVGARKMAMMPTPVHEGTGKPLPMINVIDGVVSDIDRAANGMAVMSRRYVMALPAITADRQAEVTNRSQLVDMRSRGRLSPAVRKLMADQGVSVDRLLEAPDQSVAWDDAFERPSWDLAKSWEGRGIPYGVHKGGSMGVMDLSATPHMAAFGQTGSGKSRRFLRPVIAFALAQGHRVVILGKQVDFMPFAGHPNVTILPVRELSLEVEALKYGQFLKAAVDEMGRRDAWLSSVHKSTWAQAGRETMLLVFDEYSNAMDLMPRAYADAARRFTKGLLREGRKYGLSMLLSSQRVVGLRDEVTQLGRAVFHVSDQQESRLAIGVPGAEALRDGYFMAKFSEMKVAGAFEPSDEDIASFLAERRVTPLEPLPWLDANLIDPAPAPAALNEPKSDIEQLAEAYLPQYEPGMSGNAIGRMIGKPYGGSWKEKIDQLREVFDRMSGQNQTLEGVSG